MANHHRDAILGARSALRQFWMHHHEAVRRTSQCLRSIRLSRRRPTRQGYDAAASAEPLEHLVEPDDEAVVVSEPPWPNRLAWVRESVVALRRARQSLPQALRRLEALPDRVLPEPARFAAEGRRWMRRCFAWFALCWSAGEPDDAPTLSWLFRQGGDPGDTLDDDTFQSLIARLDEALDGLDEVDDVDDIEHGSEIPAKKPKKAEWLARAMLLIDEHPDWSDAKIARSVGKSPSTLSRNKHYQEAARLARDKGRHPRRGHVEVDPERRYLDVVAYDDDDPANRDWDD